MKIYKVNTHSTIIKCAVEVYDDNKVRFWSDNVREGGYYIPNVDTITELGRIFYKYNDAVWLHNVCLRLNLNKDTVIKKGLQYYIDFNKKLREEKLRKMEMLKNEINALNDIIEYDKIKLRR